MGDNILFWVGFIGITVVAAMLFIRPFREMVLGLLGSRGPLGLLHKLFAPILHAHLTVLNNFRPRGVIYPSLETKKSTTVKD